LQAVAVAVDPTCHPLRETRLLNREWVSRIVWRVAGSKPGGFRGSCLPRLRVLFHVNRSQHCLRRDSSGRTPRSKSVLGTTRT
jgi:hypothetical protein